MFRRLNRPKLPRSNGGHFNTLSLRDDKGDRLRNVFLELLADGEPCRDCQLASRSDSQRDGCRRLHTYYGADYRNCSAPITAPRGCAVIAAANGKSILVE